MFRFKEFILIKTYKFHLKWDIFTKISQKKITTIYIFRSS